ncbi:MAG: response regulator [Oligoflexia bacterium]|nr:response regulator [Oligoflexia bacterium]
MALKILLVDPDDEWLFEAKKYFEDLLYEVKMVTNGKDAQLALYNDKFFSVVMNVEVQNHAGLQVLKFIKTNYPSQNVLMITEVSEEQDEEDQMTVEKLKKMGATEAIEKPFKFDDLKGLLEGHQSVGDMVAGIPRRKELGPEEEVNESDDTFTRVKISEFYSSQPVLFDIFIKLKSGRYVKILHAGDALDKDRIDKYKNEKNVEYFYFHKKDLFKFVKYNNYFAKKVIESKKAPTNKKIKLLQNVSEKFLEQSFEEGLKPQIIDQGKEIAENMFSLIQQQEDLFSILRSYQDFDPNAFTHAYLVSLFSTSIIQQFEWQSKTTIESTSFACFFHDIGKMQLPKELLHKKVMEMNDEELAQYKEHPELGYQLLDGKNTIFTSVKQIVLQHHEAYDGSGFPFGKRGSKIFTLANIVGLADAFTHIVQEQELKPVEALKILLKDQNLMKQYNSRIVENLINVFVDPEKIAKDNKLPSNSRVVNKKVS